MQLLCASDSALRRIKVAWSDSNTRHSSKRWRVLTVQKDAQPSGKPGCLGYAMSSLYAAELLCLMRQVRAGVRHGSSGIARACTCLANSPVLRWALPECVEPQVVHCVDVRLHMHSANARTLKA